MKEDKTSSINVGGGIDKIKSFISSTSRANQTIITVAILALIAVGFGIAFQQIGTNLIGNVDQPVQGQVDVNAGESEATFVVNSLNNVDNISVRLVGGGSLSGGDITSEFSGWDSTDEAQVGDTIKVNSLGEGDQVIIIARDQPDNTGTIHTYTHQ